MPSPPRGAPGFRAAALPLRSAFTCCLRWSRVLLARGSFRSALGAPAPPLLPLWCRFGGGVGSCPFAPLGRPLGFPQPRRRRPLRARGGGPGPRARRCCCPSALDCSPVVACGGWFVSSASIPRVAAADWWRWPWCCSALFGCGLRARSLAAVRFGPRLARCGGCGLAGRRMVPFCISVLGPLFGLRVVDCVPRSSFHLDATRASAPSSLRPLVVASGGCGVAVAVRFHDPSSALRALSISWLAGRWSCAWLRVRSAPPAHLIRRRGLRPPARIAAFGVGAGGCRLCRCRPPPRRMAGWSLACALISVGRSVAAGCASIASGWIAVVFCRPASAPLGWRLCALVVAPLLALGGAVVGASYRWDRRLRACACPAMPPRFFPARPSRCSGPPPRHIAIQRRLTDSIASQGFGR